MLGKLTQNIGVDDVIVSIPSVAVMSTPTLLTYSNSKRLLSRLYWDLRGTLIPQNSILLTFLFRTNRN